MYVLPYTMCSIFKRDSKLCHSGESNFVNGSLIHKLIEKKLVIRDGNQFYLNSYGVLAKKIGFEHYFELEALEEKWFKKSSKKQCICNSLLISFLCLLILFFGYLVLNIEIIYR